MRRRKPGKNSGRPKKNCTGRTLPTPGSSQRCRRWKKASTATQHDSGPKKNFNAELNSLVYTALTREGEFNLPCYGRQLVKGLYLEGEPLDNILYNNYERFTAKGGEVPAVTAQTIIDGCERVLQDMSDGDHSVFRSFFDELTMLRDDPDEAVATNFFAEAIRRLNG